MIKTKYLSPTNHRPARIKVMLTSCRESATYDWDCAKNPNANHRDAVRKFCESKMTPEYFDGLVYFWDDGGLVAVRRGCLSEF